MPASMHDGNVAAGVVLGMDLTGVGKPSVLLNRKCVEFGAQHDGRPGTILKHGDHAGATHMFGHIVSGTTKAGCQLRRRLGFVSG